MRSGGPHVGKPAFSTQFMRTLKRFIPFGLAAVLALPVAAQVTAVPISASLHGAVTSIAMHDTDHDGRMDRVRLTLDNSTHRTWHTNGASGFSLTHAGADIALSDAFVSTPPGAHPAAVELLIDENDADLPRTTSAAGFELSYASQGLGGGLDDGQVELADISEGDSGAHDTERDMAAPVLLGSDPVAGAYRVLRDRPIILTFSEAIAPESLTYVSSNNPGSWNVTWSGDATVATLTHGLYRVVLESFTVTGAKDLAGNDLTANGYPNPFTFETTSDNDTGTPDAPNPVLAVTRPAAFSTVEIGTPTLINWYTNETEATHLRLSYSTNGGVSYETIATVPSGDHSHVWYPPNRPGSLILKAESLTASGGILNITTVNPLTLSLPDAMPAPFAVAGPNVTDVNDTSATVSVTLDRPVASVELVCGGITLATASGTPTSPSQIEVVLTGLVTEAEYDCRFDLTDLFGQASSLTIPRFVASSAGDTEAPSIVGIPKVDMYDAEAGTVRLTWSTDEPSTGYINYGPYINYSNVAESTTLKTTHRITLTENLTPGELHQARVTMFDAEGNAAVTDDVWFVFLTEAMLVKAKDSSAVYLYEDGTRKVFPNATIYRSWYGDDFSEVVTIPKTQLGTLALGGNMKVKADSYLVKITSDPKTYAVEPDGTLRWIPTEDMARTLYGDAWNTLVRDIDVSLFVDYAIGAPLTDGERPLGYDR